MSSEETISNNSAVIGQSAVSLSTTDYRKLLTTVFSQNQKIQALKNLHHLVQSKDSELKMANEKVQNLQLALDRAETRLVNQIRLAAASKAPSRRSTLEADSAACCDDVRRVATPMKSQVTRDNVDPAPHERLGTFVRTSSPLTELESSEYSVRDTALQSFPLRMPSSQCVSNGGNLTSLDVDRNVSLPSKSFSATGGVSKDLLSKLMQQNARLRKVVKDILEQRGTTLETHLEKQEAQDVVNQLREELRLSKQQNERLKQIINTKDEDDVLRKYTEQSENLQKAKKTITTLQAMVDAYGKEFEKLQQENKALKEQLTSAVVKQKARTSETKGSKDSTQAVTVQETCDNGSKVEEAFGKLNTECENHGEHFKELQETMERYKEEAAKAEQLKERCEMLETSKQLLESQIAVFREDFSIEHEEFLKKEQQNGAIIAKHQDMIRQLAAQVQKSRSGLEEEMEKRKSAESACRDLEKRFHEFIAMSRSESLSSCRNVDTSSVVPSRRCPDLQVDNPVEASSSLGDLCTEQSLSQRSFSDSNGEEGAVAFVCPRCEREFERNDEDKFRDHTSRCTDD